MNSAPKFRPMIATRIGRSLIVFVAIGISPVRGAGRIARHDSLVFTPRQAAGARSAGPGAFCPTHEPNRLMSMSADPLGPLPPIPVTKLPYNAILIVAFGGPEGPEDVMPFLENVLRGRNVPRERMLAVAEHYNR